MVGYRNMLKINRGLVYGDDVRKIIIHCMKYAIGAHEYMKDSPLVQFLLTMASTEDSVEFSPSISVFIQI